MNNNNGDPRLDITVQYESSEPINLKRIKQIWEHNYGIKYDTRWIFDKDGQVVESEDTIISQNFPTLYRATLSNVSFNDRALLRDDIESDLQRSNILNKIIRVTSNEIFFADNLNVYKLHDEGDAQFNVQKINLKNKRQEESMFFMDNDDDPFNGEMVLF